MAWQHSRWVAVAFFAAGAVLAGIGNGSGNRVLSGLAFPCFGLGVLAFLRWRAAFRARVFDQEEKTSEEPPV